MDEIAEWMQALLLRFRAARLTLPAPTRPAESPQGDWPQSDHHCVSDRGLCESRPPREP